jgi:predicted molibdopterin-dependent oxidoreductase YjgC
MIKFKIDNSEFEATEGTTILHAVTNAGLDIPTLCHKNGMPHYSSCMVCIVKDNNTNNYLPSCSALVQDGMDLDISGEDVISLRKKAVEMLLSEHRAECEAPCRVVCPEGYNIPLMNRLLIENNYDGALELTASEIGIHEIKCIECPGYCENACRRKKIDIPVSIRNMKLFIYQHIKSINPNIATSDNTEKEKQPKHFSSRIGRLEPTEQLEWLKECIY